MRELDGEEFFEHRTAVRSERADVTGDVGHGGTVWGGGTTAMIRAAGRRRMTVAVNLQRWNRLDSSGRPQPHAVDDALAAFVRSALYD